MTKREHPRLIRITPPTIEEAIGAALRRAIRLCETVPGPFRRLLERIDQPNGRRSAGQ